MSRYLVILASIFSICSLALADDFSGSYQGKTLTAQIQSAADGYSGTLTLGENHFPLKAQIHDGKLQGTFTSQGTDFAFIATLNANHLTLVSGGVTYEMDRPGVANPLAAGAQAEQPAAAGEALAGYSVVADAPGGRAMFINKPAPDVDGALKIAVRDLEHFLDGRPAISGAFADVNGKKSGGAFFTGKYKAHDVKGSIFCGLGEKGAAITIVYDRTDAPPAEWLKLIAALPSQMTMKTHQFPDGTGSVDLPEGWTTVNQSVVGGVRITGPANQVVTLGMGAEVVTPDSTLVKLHDQLAMQAMQMGGPPPPPITMLVAPYSGPVDALKNLIPQIDHMSRQANGPGVRLDKIIQTTDATPVLPNGKASLIYWAWTQSDPNTTTPYRSLSQIETYVVGEGTWGCFFTELASPDKTFDRDIPVMRQIAQSFKCNDQAVMQVTQNIIAANNQRFAALQQANKEKNEAFDSLVQSWHKNEVINSRCNADFDEVIKGYRTMEDTTTGERTSVDLGKIHDVVDKLNEYDPGRYKEIPLRDEMYPQ